MVPAVGARGKAGLVARAAHLYRCAMSYRLFCFLGNPGSQYARTRHNVAWMVESAIPGSRSYQGKFKGRFAKEGQSYLLLPETYMNRSGESLSACAAYFSVEPEEILVVHDETELPLGSVQLRAGGGTAGHNGLKSIRRELGTAEFHRFRLGVGRPARGNLSSYVLSAFSPEEQPTLERLLEECGRILDDMISRRQSDRLAAIAGGGRVTLVER